MINKCFRCKETKSISEFSRSSTNKSGLSTYCKDCVKLRRAELKFLRDQGNCSGDTSLLCLWCDKGIGGTRAKKYCSDSCANKVRRIESYGITVQEYKDLLQANNGVCGICEKPTDNWNIDHNHQTHETYGLVCGICNSQLLAWSFHDVELVKRLLDYLENPPVREKLGPRFVNDRVKNKNKERDTEGPWIWRKNANQG